MGPASQLRNLAAGQSASVPRRILAFGRLAAVGTVFSIVFCYGKAALELWWEQLASGPSPAINIHVQAVLMALAASVAVVGLWRDRRQHGSNIALTVGSCGLLILLWALYGQYDRIVEFAAYIALISAVFINQNRMLRTLADTVAQQRHELEAWNAQLERRVDEQVTQLTRLQRLRSFFSPPLAELIEAGGDDPLLPHRREVVVMFIDLRGFTAFAEASEPEDVISVLREYHAEIGAAAEDCQANIERFTGDGVMLIFNDPLPLPDASWQAVNMALGVRDRMQGVTSRWRGLGHVLGVGIGISKGYATIGAIGYAGRRDYAAIGTVTNIAARLCAEAGHGQILINQRVLADLQGRVRTDALGHLELKGIRDPLAAFNVVGLESSQPEPVSLHRPSH